MISCRDGFSVWFSAILYRKRIFLRSFIFSSIFLPFFIIFSFRCTYMMYLQFKMLSRDEANMITKYVEKNIDRVCDKSHTSHMSDIWKNIRFRPSFIYTIKRSAQLIAIFKEAKQRWERYQRATHRWRVRDSPMRITARNIGQLPYRKLGKLDGNAIPSLPCIITRSRRHFRVPAPRHFVRYRTR